MSKFIGIDISKQTFDVSFLEKSIYKHGVYANNASGFKQFIKVLGKEDYCIMEASGCYYLQLANFLYGKGIKVVVENPLVIKRFGQSRLYRAKTDKKDASVIAEYGMKNQADLRLWIPGSPVSVRIRQLYTRLELLSKQLHQNRQQLMTFQDSGAIDTFLETEILSSITLLEKHKNEIEQQIEQLAQEQYKQTLDNLESIPAIGRKTAVMLCVLTDNFTRFNHYKQLIAYVGLSPRVYKSGTSVNGKGRICKMGTSQIRKLLYLCSWSAKRCNAGCREMYERLKQAGKPERVIKIAIANKLLKQAFAIATKNERYQLNFS